MNHRKPTTGSKIRAALRRYSAPLGIAAALLAVNFMTPASAVISATPCKWGAYPLCPNSVAAKQVVDNSLPASKILPADRAAFLKDINTPDVYGQAKLFKGYDATTISQIGGSFKTGKTPLGAFVLPVGIWELKANVVFHTTVAIPDGVRPQFALRVGSTETAFGDDFGTIMGTEISSAADRELTGNSTKLVHVTEPTTVGAFGFGYSDSTGSEGSGKITVAAEVWAVRVG